jgi:acyl transferase domain-containing protein
MVKTGDASSPKGGRKLTEGMEIVKTPGDGHVAIIGMSCRFPGAPTLREFWELLCAGKDAITDVPPERFDVDAHYDPDPRRRDSMVSRRGGFLPGVEDFDAAYFGISPHEARRMDPQHRLMLESTHDAVDDAGLRAEDLAGSDAAVFTCVSLMSEYWPMLVQANMVDMHSVLGSGMYGTAAGRISHALDLRGPTMSVDATCASGLLSLQLARNSLLLGETDLALLTGVSLLLSPVNSVGLSNGTILSPTGRCRFGDADAEGYVRSEGVASVVLKRLADAVADGDRIYAVIAGVGTSSDGRTGGSLMTPGGAGQEKALRAAYRDAGLEPSDVDYVEAHGTGTVTGDRVELSTLGDVVGAGRAADRPCLVGSVKSNIGHVESAAGLAGLIKTALAVNTGVIPATLHVENLNPVFAERNLPLVLPQAMTEWPRSGGPRIAGVNSFGISGTNGHVVLLEPPRSAPVEREPARARLLPVSAKAPAAVRALAEEIADVLPTGLDDVCFSAGTRRSHHRHRITAVGHDAESMAAALRTRLAQPSTTVTAPPKVTFVFSGLGSAWTGMARQLLAELPVFRDRLLECDAAVRAEAGWSLLSALESGEPLTGVEREHPALWAVQVALAAVWEHWGVRPDEVIGQSIGEVAAATVSGALTVAEGAAVVCRRAAMLAKLPDTGGMLLVRLPVAEAEEAMADHRDSVSVGVISSNSSTVLSGDLVALSEIADSLQARGVFCRRVSVGYASHSAQMRPLRPGLIDALSTVDPSAGRVPLRSTTTGHTENVLDGTYWADNLCLPVLLAPTLRAAVDQERPTLFVEISPHPLLLNEIEDVLLVSDRPGWAVGSVRREEPETESLLRGAGAAYEAGCELDWLAVNGRGDFVALPGYPWQRRRLWLKDRSAPSDAVVEPTAVPTDLRHRVIHEVGRLLALPPGEVDETRSLAALGVDSLLASRLRTALAEALEITIPIGDLLSPVPVGELAGHLVLRASTR